MREYIKIGDIKTKFLEKDNWDDCLFFSIYEENEEKHIRIEHITKRQLWGKNYHSWTELNFGFFAEDCPSMEIKDFLRWDKDYNLDRMLSPYEQKWHEIEDPEDAFDIANMYLRETWVFDPELPERMARLRKNAKRKFPSQWDIAQTGRRRCPIIFLDEDTPCGSYYDCFEYDINQ